MRLVIIFLLLGSFNFTFSQTTVVSTIQEGSKYSIEDLSTAISKADWCGYFHVNQRVKLKFDDGAIVELFSKKDLISTEYKDDCFQNEKTEDIAIYKIHESGIIVRMLSARNTTKN